jgi:lipopolysaccharide/colanic/teichoic acid biosynthesis glycosyltransferase
MKIVYIHPLADAQQKLIEAFPKHQVKCFADLEAGFDFMRQDHIPDIIVTPVYAPAEISGETMKIIRAKPAFRKTIIIGYSDSPDRSNINKFLNDGYLDVVATEKVITTLFQVIHLFTHKHGRFSLLSIYSRRSLIAKRIIDISFSSTVLLLASPILLLTALAIRLESKGPILYRSKRVGSNYKIFDLLKFRTMIPGADKSIGNMSHLNLYAEGPAMEIPKTCPDCERLGKACSPIMYADNQQYCENFYFFLKDMEKQGIFFKAKNDPRISRVGKFLRNSSIDELPQLINILKGDMSLVGNRPLPLYEAEKLTTDTRAFRFLAPAGLTGLWQVTKRGKKDMSEEERIALDNNYALNHSILLDVKIILKTFPAMLQSENV